MTLNLGSIVRDLAHGIKLADSANPVALSARDQHAYQPGIGPHTESQTIELAYGQLSRLPSSPYLGSVYFQVPYPLNSRNKCDVCLGKPHAWEWAIEIKMLRMMGDNGKPNDNMLMHILSPYPAHHSALTDCQKLIEFQPVSSRAIIIFGYEYLQWPMQPAIDAFEHLARRQVDLSDRLTTSVGDLIHPVHHQATVYGWQLTGR